MADHCTVLGGSGFIGSHLVRSFEAQEFSYSAPERGAALTRSNLGHVIYCIGVTADFRERPYDTVRAHVCALLELLEHARFESLLYLSTTRVYARSVDSNEDADLFVRPSSADDLYNISKLMGESVCLGSGKMNVRVVRLSNVYGPDFSSNNFLSTALRDAVDDGKVLLRTGLDSEKDYVDVQDVVRVLPAIARSGQRRIYNIASGINTSNAAILNALAKATGCRTAVAPDAPTIRFPRIDTERLRQEFGFTAGRVVDAIPELVHAYQSHRSVSPA